MPGPTGVPGEPRGLLLGQIQQVRRNPLAFFEGLAAKHGPIAYARLGYQDVYLINEPDWIRDVLVTHNHRFVKGRSLHRARIILGQGLLTSEGAFHTRQRKLVQPSFYRERLQAYGEEMTACAARVSSGLVEGQPVEMTRLMMRLTLAIVGRTLFSADVEEDAGEVGQAMSDLVGMFDTLILPGSQYLTRLPFLSFTRRFRRAKQVLDGIIYRLIAERRARPTDEPDLLNALLAARDEEDRTGMTDSQVRDEALTLFVAGHETTANALAWTWYLLSRHPEAEARFHHEIDTVLGGRRPGFADLPSLPYTEQVFAEALRLYPPAWAMARRAVEEHTAGPWRLPRNSIVVISPWVTHRTAAFWGPEPERFEPGRQAAQKFSYIPFGGGPRVCIGERFAWMEGVLVLATMGQRWRFRAASGETVEPLPLLTLRPKQELMQIPQQRKL